MVTVHGGADGLDTTAAGGAGGALPVVDAASYAARIDD
eukprot:SAG31_NODE_38706_length_294_cov_0.676923_1_plen_37_part_01